MSKQNQLTDESKAKIESRRNFIAMGLTGAAIVPVLASASPFGGEVAKDQQLPNGSPETENLNNDAIFIMANFDGW